MSDLAKKLAMRKKASQGDTVGVFNLVFVLVFMLTYWKRTCITENKMR